MTVKEAIERSGAVYTADGEGERLVSLITELESRISIEMLQKDAPIGITVGSVLSVPDAYASVYPLYLMMKRELFCGDAERYAFYLAEFSRAYSEYFSYVKRNGNGAKALIKTV
jgi:hypothetical protein